MIAMSPIVLKSIERRVGSNMIRLSRKDLSTEYFRRCFQAYYFNNNNDLLIQTSSMGVLLAIHRAHGS
jgi:hypothetical protein